MPGNGHLTIGVEMDGVRTCGRRGKGPMGAEPLPISLDDPSHGKVWLMRLLASFSVNQISTSQALSSCWQCLRTRRSSCSTAQSSAYAGMPSGRLSGLPPWGMHVRRSAVAWPSRRSSWASARVLPLTPRGERSTFLQQPLVVEDHALGEVREPPSDRSPYNNDSAANLQVFCRYKSGNGCPVYIYLFPRARD